MTQVTKLRLIRANQAGESRRITHEGRAYLSVPHVAIVAGVLNGELAPAEELEKFPEAWNGRPVVIGHPPKRNGQNVSANTPEITARAPGQIWNTRFQGDRLLFDIWIDIEKAQQLGGQALEALERYERNEPTEGSTAYFRDVEPVSGTFKGRAYNGIARNLRPDHYAILLNAVGACSWLDGCGGPRTNQDVSEGVMIALYPSLDVARQLALSPEQAPGGSEVMRAEDLHLTLAYLGKIDELPAGEDVLMRQLAAWVADEPLIHGMVDGLGRFNPDETGEQHPIFATFSGPSLANFRERLVSWFEDDWPISRKHGFQPHLTLAWVPAKAEMMLSAPERMDVIFDSVALAWGNNVTLFKLQGEARQTEGSETMQANMAGRARRPSFNGTETTSWERVSKTFQAFRDGYYRHSGAERPSGEGVPSRVQDAPAEMKRWIASKTLLGDPGADNDRDLIFFPVVNPGTDKLNQGAVRAVLGGRGAAASAPAAAIESAQAMARRLLGSEFGAETQSNAIKSALVTLARAVGINLFKEARMNQLGKEELCELLAANEQCKLKPETLEKLELEELQALAKTLEGKKEGCQEDQTTGSTDPGQASATGSETQANADQKTTSTDSGQATEEDDTPAWAKALTDKVEAVANQVNSLQEKIQANDDQEKTTLIDEIAAHQEAMPKSALEKLEVDELRAMQNIFVPVDYSGRGLPRSNSGEWEDYTMPEVQASGDANKTPEAQANGNANK